MVENRTPLLGMTLSQLEDVALEVGMPQFAAKQIAQWIYCKRATSFGEMTNISKRFRESLAERFIIGRYKPIDVKRSVDGTVKYLFPTHDGQFVETVYIPDKDRATLCVSCQVGCKMNCLFCQTGKQGFSGNLTVSDILNQICSVEDSDKLTNIVFMGQGEPFDNLDNIMQSLDILTADYGWAWSPKRITVSTVGLRKNLKRFLDESECHLAISLHSPFHEQRFSLMPAEKQFPAKDIIELLRSYDFSHQRRLSFEYIVFDGVNDSVIHAEALVKLLRGLDCRINLIRFHSIPDVGLNGVSDDKMLQFRDFLTFHGIFTTIRASRGQDIYAACGLLSTAKISERENNNC
jgi:23S rRNA (adenine2503-C2)-methyltransferase